MGAFSIYFIMTSITLVYSVVWKQSVTINSNVRNVFKMCSNLFWIRCMSFWFLMKTINMLLNVPVHGTYFFYLISVYFQNLFYLTDGLILFWKCSFMRWMKEGFNSFIHTNITITWFFIPFRCAWSVFLSLISIHTRSLFMFICFLVACNGYFYALQLLCIHLINFILNCFIDVSNCFVDEFFLLMSDVIPLVRSQTCFLFLICLEI